MSPHNLSTHIKTREYFILTIKENCQTDNYGKYGKKLYFIDILAFESGKLCSGWGFCFSFFGLGTEFCTVKLSRGGDFDEKN